MPSVLIKILGRHRGRSYKTLKSPLKLTLIWKGWKHWRWTWWWCSDGSLQASHYQGNLNVSWVLLAPSCLSPIVPSWGPLPYQTFCWLTRACIPEASLPPSSSFSKTTSVPQCVHMIPCSSFNKLLLTQNISMFMFTKMWGSWGRSHCSWYYKALKITC